MLIKELPNDFPKIVCICGSTRFVKAYRKAEFDETFAGNIVLTIHCNTKVDSVFLCMSSEELDLVKDNLFELHLHQIELADEILVLNVGDYIGNSTYKEIEYAIQHHKKIRFLERHYENYEKENTPTNGSQL